ncbi:unnamed protein product [Soboliphyme baturini]|uniref:Fibronectin type-III domain-containing protein n=1 Tax=Soboliphyme baturini TaxID=241478 RepID=A0A183J1P9_9BILA|nr:unnamed protein product [Soboliphyme baturini]
MQACNAAGCGPFCNAVKAATYSRPPPPPTLELMTSAHSYLKLKWLDPKSAVFNESFTYVVEMENKNGTFSPVYEGSSKTCKVTRLSECSSYKFRVRSVSSTGGVGSWSDVFHFQTTKQLPPAIKSSPKVLNITESSALVEWSPVKMNLVAGDRLGYCVQLASSSPIGRSSVAEDFRTVYKNFGTSYQISGLRPSTTYRIRVHAVRYCSNNTNASPAPATSNKSDEQITELVGSPVTVTFSTASLAAIRRYEFRVVVFSSGDDCIEFLRHQNSPANPVFTEL